MKLIKIITNYRSQAACIKYLEDIRWSNEVACPYCSSVHTCPQVKELRHKCYDCRRSFSVLIDTIFQNSRLPLFKWFMAIHLISGAKKGISSLQLSRHLNINKDTALSLQRRIREAMNESEILEGIVEADETYIGGGMVHMNFDRRKKLLDQGFHAGGMQHKTPVLGMYNREKNNVQFKVLCKAHGKETQPILEQMISPESILVTDGFGGYAQSKTFFKEHIKLNHERKVFKFGEYNTATIESLWNLVKRAIVGVYHRISDKYLQSYLREIQFKFNNRKKNMFDILLNNLISNQIPITGL